MNRRIITQGAIAFVILSSGLALLGWQLNIPILKSGFWGTTATMKANTALSMMLSGLALGVLQSRYFLQRRYPVVQGLALGIVSMGALTLSQYLLGWNLGIDQWLFQDLLPSETSLHPGRMGLNSAINFVLVGSALLLLTRKTPRSVRLAHILSCVAASLAMTAFVGYLFGVDVFFKLVAQVTVMSPNTSVTFLGLCIGLLCICPRQGLMKVVNSPLPGGQMARRTLPWAIFLPVGLGWLAQEGVKLHWYDAATGHVLGAVAMQIVLSILIWWNAKALNQADDVRQHAEADLTKANENRIKAKERTAILQQETQRLEAIINAQQVIIQNGSEPNAVMALIVERAQQLTRADGAVLELVEGHEMVYHCASGTAATHVGLRLDKTASLSGRCVEIAEIICCHNIETDPTVNIDACRKIGAQSMIVVPLLQQGHCVGVLKVFSAHPHSFTAQDIQALKLMAVFLASALALASAFEEKSVLLRALQDSEQRYRSVIESLSEGIVLQDAASVIQTSNASAEAILGLSLDQMMGRSSLDPRWRAIHEDGSPFPGEQHPAMVTLQTGQPVRNVVMGVYKPDNSLTWISINAQPLHRLGESLPHAVVTSFSDITERRRVEEQIRLVQILALEIAQAQDFTSALGAVLTIVSRMRGFAVGEAWIPCPQDNVLKCEGVWHQENQDEVEHQISNLDAFQARSKAFTFAQGVGLPGRVWRSREAEWCTDVSQQPETLFLRRQLALDFGIKTALGIPILANQDVLAVLVFFKLEAIAPDHSLIESLATVSAQLSSVLQRKRIEDALRDNEQRLRLALEGSGDGLWSWDISTGEEYFSPQWLSMLGYAAGDLARDVSTWENLIHPEDRPWVMNQLHMHLQKPSVPYRFDYRLLTKSGEWKWIANYGKVVTWDAAGQPLQMSGVHRDIDAKKRAELALRQSEAELCALFEAMHDLVLVRDVQGRCLKVLSNRSENLVRPVEDMVGTTLHEVLPQEQADFLLNSIHQSLTLGRTVACDYSLEIKGKNVWFSAHISPLSVDTVTLVIRNISDRKRLEQELFREKELAQVTLHSIGDAVITTDADGKVQYFNPVAEALTGWNQPQACGKPLAEVFNIIHETTRDLAENPIEKALREGQTVGLANHTLLISREGREIPIEDSAAPIRDRSGNLIGAVLVFHDVTQTRSLTRQLSWEATHDPLTQLVNRREFENRVEQALTSAQSQGCRHALCYLDLDQFKIVNDTCGHGAGDELLRQVTALLQSQVRKTDILARLGGDEFGVLLHQCPLPQALRVANEMRECIQAVRFTWQGQTFKIGASIGLIDISADSESLSSLLSAADAACYAAKNKGRNRVHVFAPNDQELLQQRGEMQWATRLTQALEEDAFCLYYQPIAAIATTQGGEHYEVLLRLQDEAGNLVAPMAFIPAAERYGLMHLIDRWVIRTLFSTQGQHYRDLWQQCQLQGFCNSLFAINLSGASINDDRFIEFLHEQFAQHQVPPQLICFEITETMAIANLTKANQFIHELRDLGCRFALDDFGSGMSSFGYLKNLPVDYLKIDGGFIRNIVDDPVDEAMVKSMTCIGHVMGLQIIAEFVENDAILAHLKTLGIDYAQGYGIAKPQPLLGPI